VDPVGVGVDWMIHEVPFHCSANPEVRVLVEVAPTAVHAAADVHEMAKRLL
jgi:hypothetical protein